MGLGPVLLGVCQLDSFVRLHKVCNRVTLTQQFTSCMGSASNVLISIIHIAISDQETALYKTK